MRVMVTGAAGQLGASIVRWFAAGHEVVALRRGDLDISDSPAVHEAITSMSPDVLINCAAYNQVDDAEDHAAAALEANAMGVASLARGARQAGAVLIHYSTDFVFDGQAAQPYVETDAPAPLGVYGMSKLLGEWLAADAKRAYVLRVESLFGGQPAKSSVDRILAGIREGAPVRVFSDRVVTPSYVEDVVLATDAILKLEPPAGTYHCVNSGEVTWLGLAEEAARLMGARADLVPVRVSEVPLRVRRPQYCALSNEKLRRAGIPMPPWQDALARYLRG